MLARVVGGVSGYWYCVDRCATVVRQNARLESIEYETHDETTSTELRLGGRVSLCVCEIVCASGSSILHQSHPIDSFVLELLKIWRAARARVMSVLPFAVQI